MCISRLVCLKRPGEARRIEIRRVTDISVAIHMLVRIRRLRFGYLGYEYDCESNVGWRQLGPGGDNLGWHVNRSRAKQGRPGARVRRLGSLPCMLQSVDPGQSIAWAFSLPTTAQCMRKDV